MNTHRTHQKLFKNGLLFGALLLGLAFSFKEATPAKAVTANFNGPIFRLYNPNSGEHVYTMNLAEKVNLTQLGWGYEGVLADSYYNYPGVNYTKIPVYRLYNSQSGQHLYTKNTYEVSSLRTKGWSNEGIVFYDSSNCPPGSILTVYRRYNPNNGQYFFTNNFIEAAYLDSIGWQNEGIAFEFNLPNHWDGPVRPA